jgi:hypothetical protein
MSCEKIPMNVKIQRDYTYQLTQAFPSTAGVPQVKGRQCLKLAKRNLKVVNAKLFNPGNDVSL